MGRKKSYAEAFRDGEPQSEDWGWSPRAREAPEQTAFLTGVETWLRPLVPWLGPLDGVVAATLAGSLLLTWVLQFGTAFFEWLPAAATAFAFVNAGLALFLAILIVSRRQWQRGPVIALLVCAAVFVAALGSWGAKAQWQRALAGSPHYTLPAHGVPLPPGATELSLRASDGVSLQAVYWGAQRPYGVVYVPGWRASRQSFSVVTLATWLANDLDVLVLESRGQGDSGGFKTPDGQERLDVLAAVRHLRANGHRRVAVLAEQDAALPALYAVAEGRGVDALVVVAPTGAWGEGLGGAWNPQALSGRLYWRVAGGLRLAAGPAPPTLADLMKRAAPTPLWFLGTQAESGTPLDIWYKAAQEPKGLFVFGGTGRPVEWSHFYEYYQSVAQWLALTLAPPSPGPGLNPDE